MLFPKTVSPHKQRLAQIKVAVDSICTPPLVIPHNLNIFHPNFAHEIQKKSLLNLRHADMSSGTKQKWLLHFKWHKNIEPHNCKK
jgi:hypothetical protein